MKVLAFFMLWLGFIAFWSFRPDAVDRQGPQSDAVALNYAQFRNAVLEYAMKKRAVQNVLPDDPGLTALPPGWAAIRDWQGLIQTGSDGRLYCYVYGPARPEEIVAVQKLFNHSMAVGWNDAGVFARNGDPLPLPSAIPHGAVVSVIRVD